MTVFRLAVVILAVVALLTAACGSNPNEDVQSNELFRPAAEGADQQAISGDDQDAGQQGSAAQQAGDVDSEAQQQGEMQAGEQAQQSDDQRQADAEQQQDAESATSGDDRAPLETSDDIIRRYSNPTYGYSFELICSPFCNPNSNGIDRVSFLSETGRALIGVDVVVDDGADSETLIRASLLLAENVEFESIEESATVTGEPAERFDWEEDRRATGGFQVRWHALMVRWQGLAIILRAGAVMDDYDGVAPALERALSSFIMPLELTARPGRYDRFGFVFEYDTEDTAQEFGQPTSNPASEEAGIFVLQSTAALKAVLAWQVLGEAFYDGDTAIGQSLRDTLGIENVTGLGDWGEVDGRPARSGETETQFGEGTMMVRSFAWYCRDSGREFTLHVLDPEDPESVALRLIESFRCDAEAEEAGTDSQSAE